jgi:hypothetical protein
VGLYHGILASSMCCWANVAPFRNIQLSSECHVFAPWLPCPHRNSNALECDAFAVGKCILLLAQTVALLGLMASLTEQVAGEGDAISLVSAESGYCEEQKVSNPAVGNTRASGYLAIRAGGLLDQVTPHGCLLAFWMNAWIRLLVSQCGDGKGQEALVGLDVCLSDRKLR